jgi:enoyl-CoA hydratase/carnithine racemase
MDHPTEGQGSRDPDRSRLEPGADGQTVRRRHRDRHQLIGNSPFGVWMTEEVMWSNLEAGSMQAAIDLENGRQILTAFTEDLPEAMRTFLEQRKPEFRNR